MVSPPYGLLAYNGKNSTPLKISFENQKVSPIVKRRGRRVTFGLGGDETGFEKNWLLDG